MASNLGARRLSSATVRALSAHDFQIIGTAATRGKTSIVRVANGWAIKGTRYDRTVKTVGEAISAVNDFAKADASRRVKAATKGLPYIVTVDDVVIAEARKVDATKAAEVCTICGYLTDSIGHQNSH